MLRFKYISVKMLIASLLLHVVGMAEEELLNPNSCNRFCTKVQLRQYAKPQGLNRTCHQTAAPSR